MDSLVLSVDSVEFVESVEEELFEVSEEVARLSGGYQVEFLSALGEFKEESGHGPDEERLLSDDILLSEGSELLGRLLEMRLFLVDELDEGGAGDAARFVEQLEGHVERMDSLTVLVLIGIPAGLQVSQVSLLKVSFALGILESALLQVEVVAQRSLERNEVLKLLSEQLHLLSVRLDRVLQARHFVLVLNTVALEIVYFGLFFIEQRLLKGVQGIEKGRPVGFYGRAQLHHLDYRLAEVGLT